MSRIFQRRIKSKMPVAVAGEGVYLIDSEGKRYIDASGGAAVSCLGHGDDVGAHIEFLCGKWGSHPAKAGDDLIKNQQ